MTQAPFLRARTEEQRAQRRAAVLHAARGMLAEQRVADLSLNELARRVGLAKSNVLRYFESREAVLLELLVAEEDAWLDDLERALDRGSGVAALTRAIVGSLERRPLLCELWAASAAVLEHNVSVAAVVAYKRAVLGQVDRLGALIECAVGPMDARARLVASGSVQIVAGAVWSASRHSSAVAGAYAAHPELAPMRFTFAGGLTELLEATLTGLVALGSDPS